MVSLALDKESNWTYRFTSLASLPKKPSGTEAIAFEEKSLWEQTNYLTKLKVMLHNRGYRKKGKYLFGRKLYYFVFDSKGIQFFFLII